MNPETRKKLMRLSMRLRLWQQLPDILPVRLLLLAAIVLPASAGMVSAQGRSSDALLHDPLIRYQYVGLSVGYGYWKSDAQFGVSEHSLPCATFYDGDGGGLLLQAKGMFYPLRSTWLFVSPRIQYESRASTFITPLPGEPVRVDGGERVILEQEAQVDADFATLTFDLLVGVEIAETGFYLAAGGSGGLLLNGQYDYTERLLTPGFTFAGSGETEQQLLNGRDFENYGSFVADVRGSIGYMYRVSDALALNIEGIYSYPLVSAFNEPDLLKQQGVMGLVGVLLNVGD